MGWEAVTFKSNSTKFREQLVSRTRKTMIESGKKIGRLTPSQTKTPSQRKSENARRKDAARAGVKFVQDHYPCDCWKCPSEPCGKTLEQCGERSMVHRCKKCGAKVRHRIDPVEPWEYCPVCIGGAR